MESYLDSPCCNENISNHNDQQTSIQIQISSHNEVHIENPRTEDTVCFKNAKAITIALGVLVLAIVMGGLLIGLLLFNADSDDDTIFVQSVPFIGRSSTDNDTIFVQSAAPTKPSSTDNDTIFVQSAAPTEPSSTVDSSAVIQVSPRNMQSEKSCRCTNGLPDEEIKEKTLNEKPSNNAFPRECGKAKVKRRKRIVHGKIANVLDHPWQVQLQRRESTRWKHHCGGTLIKEDAVLTAAHCFQSYLSGLYVMSDFRIVTGQQEVLMDDSTEAHHDISYIHLHKDFDETFANDIALIIFKPIQFGNSAQPACLPNPIINDYSEGTSNRKQNHNSQILNKKLVISGYGTTEYGQQYSAELRVTTIDAISTEQCQDEFQLDPYHGMMPHEVKITTNICGKDLSATNGGVAKADCVGDSGGPVVTDKGGKFVLVGIVSWGRGCNDETNHLPSVYTRVRCYLTWIHQKLGRSYNECNK